MIDITKHFSDLNLKLQRKDQIITDMCDQVNAFKYKLVVWENQLKNENFIPFPTCKTYKSSFSETSSNEKYFGKFLTLRTKFETRFLNFKSLEEKLYPFYPIFSINIESVPSDMPIEVINIHFHSNFKEKFAEVGMVDFYKCQIDLGTL